MRPLPHAFAFLFFIVLGTVPLPAQELADAQPNVSLDDPVYPFLDRLEGMGLLKGAFLGLRPYSRSETARLLSSADAALRASPRGSPAWLREELARFIDRFRWAVAARGGFGRPPERLPDPVQTEGKEQSSLLPGRVYARPEIYIQPLGGADLRCLSLSGDEAPELTPGRNAGQGMQLFSSLSAHGRILSWACFHVRPELRLGPQPGQSREAGFDLVMRESYLKVHGFGFDLLAGHDDLAWGPGRHSSIILSGATEPLEMIKLETPSPFRLPWIFTHAGEFRFTLFAARLERARVVPHAILGGLKVNWKPFPWIELGATRSVQFAGEGRPHVGMEELWKIWWGIYDNVRGSEEDLSNQLAGFDGRVRLSLAGMGFTLYGEAIGEDETNMFPYKWSTILGLHVVGLPPDQRIDFRLEWAHTHRVAYRHGTYGTGYTFRGDLLGHHIGRDAKDIYLEASFVPTACVRIAGYIDWEIRRDLGSFQPEEEHLQFGMHAEWRHINTTGFTLRVEYRLRKIRNVGYVRGEEALEHFVGMAMSWAP